MASKPRRWSFGSEREIPIIVVPLTSFSHSSLLQRLRSREVTRHELSCMFSSCTTSAPPGKGRKGVTLDTAPLDLISFPRADVLVCSWYPSCTWLALSADPRETGTSDLYLDSVDRKPDVHWRSGTGVQVCTRRLRWTKKLVHCTRIIANEACGKRSVFFDLPVQFSARAPF